VETGQLFLVGVAAVRRIDGPLKEGRKGGREEGRGEGRKGT
jgi:hypothetical protein